MSEIETDRRPVDMPDETDEENAAFMERYHSNEPLSVEDARRIIDLLQRRVEATERRLKRNHNLSVRQLMLKAHETATKKGWHETPIDFGMALMLATGELAEALEQYRIGRAMYETYVPKGSDKPEGIPSEMADAVIRIMDTCQEFGIPLQEAMIQKMAYNDTRPYRHGGKRA